MHKVKQVVDYGRLAGELITGLVKKWSFSFKVKVKCIILNGLDKEKSLSYYD